MRSPARTTVKAARRRLGSWHHLTYLRFTDLTNKHVQAGVVRVRTDDGV